MEANFSTLLMSIGSSAFMSLGHTPNPQTGKTEKDIQMAEFNIDLLRMLQKKTEGNLDEEEKKFLTTLLSDLQLQFLNNK